VAISNKTSSNQTGSSETLGSWLQRAEIALMNAGVFLGHGTDNYWDEALHLSLPSLGIGFDADRTALDRELTMEQTAALDILLHQRIDQRIPVPYLTGEAWFSLLPFYVDRSVLIPRSPLAELVECGFEPWFIREGVVASPRTILDLCCGSGCIGIAAAHYLPECHVDLADLSPEALAVAVKNIRRHDMGARVQCYQGDLFSAVPSGRTYDVIVCNPPYVDVRDMANLPPEYHHEPPLALAAGQDGLDLVRRILAEASDYLNEGGLLIVEVGNSAEALEEHYPEVPFLWLEFMRGGDGVFLLTKEQLEHYFFPL
jgi:ribosomal protein L3 glutamine methyltransferase